MTVGDAYRMFVKRSPGWIVCSSRVQALFTPASWAAVTSFPEGM